MGHLTDLMELDSMMSSERQKPEYLAIARIVAPHGVHGEVRAAIFTEFPERNQTFCIACDEVLSRPGASIAIDFQLSDPERIPLPNPTSDLILIWEYWQGEKWVRLGLSQPKALNPKKMREGEGLWRFRDETRALSRNGAAMTHEGDVSRAMDAHHDRLDNGLVHLLARGPLHDEVCACTASLILLLHQ